MKDEIKTSNGIKSELRERAKAMYAALDMTYIKESSDAIADALFTMRWYREAETVLCYINFGSEVMTSAILEEAAASGKRICIPRCIDNMHMEARIYCDAMGGELKKYKPVKGHYGISEPTADAPLVEPREIDFGIIPCVACSRECVRLGHGGGYYDRFLKRSHMHTACLCFEKLIFEDLPKYEHDVLMDAVITENKIYK